MLGLVLSSFTVLVIVLAITLRLTILKPIAGTLGEWSEWGECPSCITSPHFLVERKREYTPPQFSGMHSMGFDKLLQLKECVGVSPCDVTVSSSDFQHVGTKTWEYSDNVLVATNSEIREANYVEYTFDIFIPGKYVLEYRVFSPNENANSFYSWDSSSNEWDGEYINDRIQGWSSYTHEYPALSEGPFTIRLATRELGVGIDTVTLRFVE